MKDVSTVQQEVEEEAAEREIVESIDDGFTGLYDASKMPPRTSMYVKSITPDESKRIDEECNGYEKQRNKKKRRIEELKRKVKDGRFHGGEVVIVHLVGWEYTNPTTGNKYKSLLMNGQHNLQLITETGISQLTTFKEFEAHSPDQLGVLFAQFDAPGGQRTSKQISSAYSELFSGWSDPATSISNMASALVFDVPTGEKYTRDERIELLLRPSVRPRADVINNLLYSNSKRRESGYKHMYRTCVIASFFDALEADIERAKTFFTKVMTGVDCAQDSPELALREFLRSEETRVGKDRKVPKDIYSRCMTAWEAFCDGRSIKRFGRVVDRKRKAVAI